MSIRDGGIIPRKALQAVERPTKTLAPQSQTVKVPTYFDEPCSVEDKVDFILKRDSNVSTCMRPEHARATTHVGQGPDAETTPATDTRGTTQDISNGAGRWHHDPLCVADPFIQHKVRSTCMCHLLCRANT
jgi:hypothetical protein